MARIVPPLPDDVRTPKWYLVGCDGCGKLVEFTTNDLSSGIDRGEVYYTLTCPSCNKLTYICEEGKKNCRIRYLDRQMKLVGLKKNKE